MLKITFFGTTTLLFDDGKDQILFDLISQDLTCRSFSRRSL